MLLASLDNFTKIRWTRNGFEQGGNRCIVAC